MRVKCCTKATFLSKTMNSKMIRVMRIICRTNKAKSLIAISSKMLFSFGSKEKFALILRRYLYLMHVDQLSLAHFYFFFIFY